MRTAYQSLFKGTPIEMITKFIGIEVLKNIKINLGSVALFVQLWSELLLLPQSLSVAMEMLIMLRHPVTGLYK